MTEAVHRPQKNQVKSERKIRIPACIGIGSNLDEPVSQVRQALAALETIDETRLIAASSLYRNPPMGAIEQPDYVNAVATLLTALAPRDLLARLQDLERGQGRVRKNRERWAKAPGSGYSDLWKPDDCRAGPEDSASGHFGAKFCIVPLTRNCAATAYSRLGPGKQSRVGSGRVYIGKNSLNRRKRWEGSDQLIESRTKTKNKHNE